MSGNRNMEIVKIGEDKDHCVDTSLSNKAMFPSQAVDDLAYISILCEE